MLLLVDVAAFSPAEVAGLLDNRRSPAGAKPAPAGTFGHCQCPARPGTASSAPPDLDSETLRRYLAALESADANQLAELLRADVTYENAAHRRLVQRARGRPSTTTTAASSAARARAVLTSANGYPAVAMYTSDDGRCFRALRAST